MSQLPNGVHILSIHAQCEYAFHVLISIEQFPVYSWKALLIFKAKAPIFILHWSLTALRQSEKNADEI